MGALLATPHIARAAPDSIELQLPAASVLELIADRARAGIECFPPLTFGLVDIVVDHIAFPAPPSLRRSPALQSVALNAATSFDAHPIQIAVPVKMFLKLNSQLEDPTRDQDQYFLTPETSAIFDLAVRTRADGVDEMCATMSTLEPAIPFQNDVLPNIRSQLGDSCFPINLDGLDDILDGKVAITSRGVSADAALTRLAVRLEFDRPNPNLTRWRSFVNDGALTNAGGASGFALTFDKNLLARVMRERFSDNLDDPRLEVESPGLQTWWVPGAAMMNLFFNAQLDVVGCANTIGAHPVNVAMNFGLSADSTNVVMNGQMSWDLVDSDVFLCGFTWAVFLGHYGLAMDPVAMGVLGGLSNAFGPGSDQLPPECTMGNNNNFSCNFPLVLPELKAGGSSHRSATLNADTLSATFEDLVISGPMNLHGYTTLAPSSTIAGGQVTYGITGGCSSLSLGYHGSVTASGRGGLCRAMQIDDDPLHIFHIEHMNEIYGAPFDNDLLIIGDLDAYAADPYAANVVIHTAGGGRALPLGPFSVPSQAEIRDLQFEYVTLKANCMAKQTGLFGIPGKFDPRWKVDPPHDIAARIVGDLAAARRGARVALEDVKLEAVGRQTRPRLGSFAFNDQSMRITATAVIDFGAAGRVKVPVTATVRGTLRGRELGRTGIVSASFAEAVKAEFTVASGLPRGVSQVSFGVDLSPGNVALQGVLTPQ